MLGLLSPAGGSSNGMGHTTGADLQLAPAHDAQRDKCCGIERGLRRGLGSAAGAELS